MSLISATAKPEGCKLLRIRAEISDPPGPSSLILAITINGDFFAIPEEAFEKIEAGLEGCSIANSGTRFDQTAATLGVSLTGINGQGLREALLKGLADKMAGRENGQ